MERRGAMKVSAKRADSAMTIAAYVKAQKPELGAICRLLQKEIDAALPKATAKIYHSSPAWFMGENAVVGFSVTPKKKVILLFWNGQALKEPDLEAVGKFKAAQVQFGDKSEIDPKKLKKWLKKAGKDIWDFEAYRRAQT
jgi:uncharacterized protein YdhG (YjbR/CyaY superfamily)